MADDLMIGSLESLNERVNLLDVEVRNEHGANAILSEKAERFRNDIAKHGSFLYEGRDSVTAVMALLYDDMLTRRKKEFAMWSALVTFALGLISLGVKVFLLGGAAP